MHQDKATNILYRKFINICIKYTKDKIETSEYRAIYIINMKKRQTNPYFHGSTSKAENAVFIKKRSFFSVGKSL